jgi:dTDP-4-dehydrorhamnose reductase
MSKNILVTGSKGQLGSEFKNLEFYNYNYNFFFNDSTLDISKIEDLECFILKHNINIILNTAAYTNVDKAEIEEEKANKVNSLGVKNLVVLSEKYNCKLVHYSTDYVYNSPSSNPISENTFVNPINNYGKSKRRGEIFIEKSCSESIIIRTSWLYSNFGKNFVNTIIKRANKEKQINVINNQFGCPTYAKDLALDTLKILGLNNKLDSFGKIYNYSNLGSTSWSQFAQEIVEILNLDCKIIGVSTIFSNTNVKRPKYSITNKNKILKDFNLDIPHWRHSLLTYLNTFKK